MRVRHYGSERGDVEYYYDDGAVLEEYVAGAGGGLLAHYRYGDRLLSLDTGAETQYYHHDALGSTVNLTDGAGLTKVRYTLDPWGHIRSQIGTTVNRQVFTGQEHDENTGLIYFGARYYDPDTGRFISQDSYLGEPGTPPSLHRYLYAYSNPTVWVDPNGHWVVTEAIADKFHEWADSVREHTDYLNRTMDQQNGWEKAGSIALAAAGGVGTGIIDIAGGAVDLVDLGVDSNLANNPLLKNTSWGREAQQRMSGIKEKAFAAGKGFAAMTKSSAEMWVEDPQGTFEQSRIGLETIKDEVVGGIKDFGGRLVKGDLNAVASTSAATFDVAATIATMGGSQVTKVGKVRQAGEIVEGLVENTARFGDDAVKFFKPGEVLSDGRVAGYGPGAALKDSSEFVSPIGWCQKSQSWRDVVTGQYTKGPKIPRGIKPSKWKSKTVDLTNDALTMRVQNEIYEKMRAASLGTEEDSLFDAGVHMLERIIENKKKE